MPEASSPMGVAAQSAAPRGFVQFCERQPGDCDASPAELQTMQLASAQAPTAPVAAITYDWSNAFTPAAPITQPYDWSNAFAQAGFTRVAYNANEPAVARPAAARAVVRTAAGAPLTLTPAAWTLLTKTNDSVNRAIAERPDQLTYGVSEYWATPLENGSKVGDCEDYVLEKRRALRAAGVPASALSIAVVVTPRGDTHAVLLVATDKGEYVLDNLTAWVMPWTKTPYQWRERQVAGSAADWAFATAAPVQRDELVRPSGLLLASLH